MVILTNSFDLFCRISDSDYTETSARYLIYSVDDHCTGFQLFQSKPHWQNHCRRMSSFLICNVMSYIEGILPKGPNPPCLCACRRCSNYILILGLIPGLDGLVRDNCKTRQESFKVLDSVRFILRDLTVHHFDTSKQSTTQHCEVCGAHCMIIWR